MTTWSLTGRQSLLAILGRRLRAGRVALTAALNLAVRLLLVVAGLALLSAAAWTIALPLGLAAAGVSCLVLEWAVKR